jgi:hypothetical protein
MHAREPGVSTWCTFGIGVGTRQSRGSRYHKIHSATRNEAHWDDTSRREGLANPRMKVKTVRTRVYLASELTWSAAFRSPWRMPLTWWVTVDDDKDVYCETRYCVSSLYFEIFKIRTISVTLFWFFDKKKFDILIFNDIQERVYLDQIPFIYFGKID